MLRVVVGSAGWKDLKLWDKIKCHVLWKIGNRNDLKAWFDRRSLLGPISDTVTTREIYDAWFKVDTSVAELINSGNGNWPEGWVEEYPILSQYHRPMLCNGLNDETVWVDTLGNERMFGTRTVWRLLCRSSRKQWNVQFMEKMQ